MPNIDFQKGLDIVANLSKVGANLSDTTNKPKSEPKQTYRGGNSTSQPHNQTVEVKVGDQGGTQKPTIIKEKPETHIHKHFPDNRELSQNECDVRKIELEYAHEEKMAELEFQKTKDALDRAERKELEEYARREIERKREENEKRRKRLLILGAVGAGVGLGLIGLDCYTSSRRSADSRLALQSQPVSANLTIEAEGTVK